MKNRHGGRLLHVTSDSYGTIEVVEHQNKMRSLHFGNRTQQATMFLHHPHVLVHKYTQAMLTPLCWAVPRRVLMLGVGGGSLAKYLLHFFDDLSIDAVELRPEVVRIAQEFFSLPKASSRLDLHYVGAEAFLRGADLSSRYDLILVDIFLTRKDRDVIVGLGEALEPLAKLLSPDGSMTMNVIGQRPDANPQFEHLQQLFADRLYMMPVDNSNVVLLACNADIPEYEDIDFTRYEKKYGLPFRQYFNKMDPL